MRSWKWGAIILLAAGLASCGGNSTPVAVTVSPSTPQTVLPNHTDQFSAVASGSSTTTIFWQICLPPVTSTNQPTNCTQGVGPTGCPIPTVSAPLTGFGTITASGLYTAPGGIPTPNNFVVMASACAKSTDFFTVAMTIDSGIRVQISPTTPVTMGTGETFQFSATVTNPLNGNDALTWLVNGMVGGGPDCLATTGCISTTGNYSAPANAPTGAVTITAQSSADPSKQAQVTVTVVTAAAPTLDTISPTTATQGSVQQDVYLNGSNFLSTSQVILNTVSPPIIPPTPVPTTFISTQLLRATIPSSLLQQQLTLQVQVQSQLNGASGPSQLPVQAVRPAVLFSTPDTVLSTAAGANVVLTGGFFSLGGNAPGSTTATFNGVALAPPTVTDSRHITISIPLGDLSIPGLYPITVQNLGVAALAGVNLAVQPSPADFTSPLTSTPVGAGPTAVAVDPALGLAVVVNTAGNSITFVNLATQAASAPLAVGNGPTGVAIDDQLPDHLAVVVNSTDQTLSFVDLSTQTVVGTLPINLQPLTAMPPPPQPFSIGINSQTHRGIVTYQNTDQAMIIDMLTPNPFFQCTTPPCPVSVIGGVVGSGPPSYGTGQNPEVAIDSSLNWAVVTPGGQGGGLNIVDLGREAVPASGLNPAVSARPPSLVGVGTVSQSVQGIGINTETHQLLLTDPDGTTLSAFSLLDNSLTTLIFTLNGVAFDETNFVAAGINQLSNIGIAVNNNGSVVIVDMSGGKVLKQLPLGVTNPQAVAIDAAHNQAIVVNQGSNSVSFVSLGASFRPLQIAEISPSTAFVTNPPTALALTINGAGFISGSAQVFLDGTSVGGVVSNGGRTITATVPSTMLASARRYSVTVQNHGSTDTSNIAALTVIQPVSVGNAPFGVAVDTTNDIAVVTNSVDDTVSLINLLTGTVINPTTPIPVGATPEGVAVNPRLGLAAVANFASNNLSVLDDTGITTDVVTAKTCGTTCEGPTGVAIDADQNEAAITGSLSSTVSFVGSLADSGTTGNADLASPNTAPNPLAVAVDPNPLFNYAAVATSSQASTLDLFNMAGGGTLVNRINGLEGPTGVVFDPVNQVFLAANSLLNTVVIVDPVSTNATSFPVGINPTSIDYNFQASTLVTFNSASNTLSVLDYVCPPTTNNAPNCEAPQARDIIGLGGSPQFSVAIDPKLNLVVLVDITNNRALLVPLH